MKKGIKTRSKPATWPFAADEHASLAKLMDLGYVGIILKILVLEGTKALCPRREKAFTRNFEINLDISLYVQLRVRGTR